MAVRRYGIYLYPRDLENKKNISCAGTCDIPSIKARLSDYFAPQSSNSSVWQNIPSWARIWFMQQSASQERLDSTVIPLPRWENWNRKVLSLTSYNEQGVRFGLVYFLLVD